MPTPTSLRFDGADAAFCYYWTGTTWEQGPYPATFLAVTATGTAGAAVTLTLPAVASRYHYLAWLQIVLYNTAARTGGATPVLVTTTNLPAGVFTFPSAGAVGTIAEQKVEPSLPLRSSVVGTNTTIVCPATTNVIWRATAQYYTGA